jgi:CHRD domain-containing protein
MSASSVRRVLVGLLATVGLLVAGAAAAVPVANAEEPNLRTFVTQLSAENEVPGCQAGVDSGAAGVAVVQINESTGEITYRVVATNLPATIAGSPGAHIHVQDPNSPTGLTGPIVLHFERTGLDTGLVAAGTTTNPTLAAAILANPEDYYVNVHTTACPPGTVRGQLG